MWDWELMKSGAGTHRDEKLAGYTDKSLQYAHVASTGSESDEYRIHNHAMYEIICPLAGDVMYLVEGVPYRPEPGACLIIGPAVPHKLFFCSDTRYERHMLYVYYSGSDAAVSALLAQALPPAVHGYIGSMYLEPGEAEKLLECCAEMGRCAASADEEVRRLTPVFAESFAAQLLIAVKDKHPSKVSRSTSSTVDTVLAYLNQSFTHDITVGDIAERFHIGKDYCNRVFKKAVGMSIMQYIIYNRVLYAEQLLNDGTPAAQAAAKAGFINYSNFFRAYKRITGRQPREDRYLSDKTP